MNKRIFLPVVFLILLLATTLAANPVVQVITPISGSYSQGSTITIDLNIADPDTNSDYLIVDVNYSIGTTQGIGTVILEDSNLSSIFTCTTDAADPYIFDINGWGMDLNNDRSTGIRCTYSWTTTGVPASCSMIGDGSTATQCTYYLNVEVASHALDPAGGSIYASGSATFNITTGGDVNVNIATIGTVINRSIQLSERVIGGVRDQGSLIGLAIGLVIAITLLFGLIYMVIGMVPRLTEKIRRFK